jgi:hypothetical protein
MSDRTWIGEAQAAFDQALTTAGDRDATPGPDFWVARAQAAAAIASAEQTRIANLIAWKALQTAREARGIDALPLGEQRREQGVPQPCGCCGSSRRVPP